MYMILIDLEDKKIYFFFPILTHPVNSKCSHLRSLNLSLRY